MNLIEKFREISGGKSSLDLGYCSLKIRGKNENCPNPTCTKGTKHCKKCKEEYGIWVCGTSSKGHTVLNNRIELIPIESDTLLEPEAVVWMMRDGKEFERVLVKGDVNHSDKDWSEYRQKSASPTKGISDFEFKRIFNIHDKEIRKRGWVDVRKDKL
jgi:hypothetical protein